MYIHNKTVIKRAVKTYMRANEKTTIRYFNL